MRQMLMMAVVFLMLGGVASAESLDACQKRADYFQNLVKKSPAEDHPNYFQTELCTKVSKSGKNKIIKTVVIQGETDIHQIPKKELAAMKKRYCK